MGAVVLVADALEVGLFNDEMLPYFDIIELLALKSIPLPPVAAPLAPLPVLVRKSCAEPLPRLVVMSI